LLNFDLATGARFIMRIQLNGEAIEVQAVSLQELLEELSLDRRMMAVEHNLEVVPRSAYMATKLTENDRIEIVHMIGGG